MLVGLMKARRQSLILDVIEREPVRSQEQLRRRMRAAGFDVTQATLSRDIRELGLVKTADGYAQVGSEPGPAPADVATLLREHVVDIRLAQNLLVLRTPPGHANSVAVALDRDPVALL